jgi:hypothetical protein
MIDESFNTLGDSIVWACILGLLGCTLFREDAIFESPVYVVEAIDKVGT